MGKIVARLKDPEAQKIVDQIEFYLKEHPNAADTTEGILKWWLPSGEEASSLSVQQALDYLISNSVVKSSTNTNGNKVYSSNQAK